MKELMTTIISLIIGTAVLAADVSTLERVTQELVPPPHLPEHEQINTGDPKVVKIRLVVEEKEIEVAPRRIHLGIHVQRHCARPDHSCP